MKLMRRIAPPVPRVGVLRVQDGKPRGLTEGGIAEARTLKVLKSQHDPPSPEGSLIRLLAGLLTLASSSWPPSQSLEGSVAFLASPPRFTVAGPSRIYTGFPIKFSKATPEATTFFYASKASKSISCPL